MRRTIMIAFVLGTLLPLTLSTPVRAQCGDPIAGPCDKPNGTPGCDDLLCCKTVCAFEPFCCEVVWDLICVDLASGLCTTFLDCNGNGIDDAKDIASGASQDVNGNGVPDECETLIELHQRTYVHFDGEVTSLLSNHGELGVTFPEPPEGSVLWINATLNELWTVRNVAAYAIEGDGGPQTIWIAVPLPIVPGTPLRFADLRVSITPDLLLDPPLFAPLLTVLVPETPYTSGATFPDRAPPVIVPWTPPLLTDYERPACDHPDQVGRRGVPGVAEPANHCAPGAVARCLAWMFKTYRIDVDESCDEAQEIIAGLAAAMGTTATGTPNYGVPGIIAYLASKGLSNCLTVTKRRFDDPVPPTPQDLYDALNRGYDVIGLFGNYTLDENGRNVVRVNGHQVTIISVLRCGDLIQIRYRDDSAGGDKQGDNQPDKDRAVKKATLKPAGTRPESYFVPEEGLNDTDAFRWEGFISICPSRLKHTNAICGWADALGDRIIDIDDPANPTAEDLLALRRLAGTLKDLACSLAARLAGESPFPPGAAALIARIKTKAVKLDGLLDQYIDRPSTDLLVAIKNLSDDIESQAFLELEDLFDCDDDDVSDEIQIAADPTLDANGNGVLDACEPPPGDLDGDGVVDPVDLAILLAFWNTPNPIADLDGNGIVGPGDLAILLANWSQ
ncbi:MAG: hypothetical protein KDA25_01185 [Phycisphaerales bacterium]|nr:hypothetical protein [Phycisphaerales bacterium]